MADTPAISDETKETIQTLDTAARPAVYARNLAHLARFLKTGRMLTYASEAGESGRPVLPPAFVKFLYAVSFGYVGLDLILKGAEASEHGPSAAALKVFDTAVWHGFASLLLPAVTIHTLVSFSQKSVKKFLPSSPQLALWAPVAVGLGSIPLIIHPIDHGTDFMMDNTLRLVYRDQLVRVPSDHGAHDSHDSLAPSKE